MTARVVGQLAVREHGRAEAPAVLLGHGVGSSSEFLTDAFARPLLAAGWRLVTYDLRGHGGSMPRRDPADYDLDLVVADVDQLVAAVQPDVVGGVSLAGHAATAWAARGDLRSVRAVLACLPAWTGQRDAGEGLHAAIADLVRRRGVTSLIDDFRADTAMHDWLRRVLVRDWSRHDEQSLAAALVALDGARAPTASDLARIAVPLAIVAWPDDPGHPLDVATEWARHAADATVTQLLLDDLDDGLERFGEAAVRALAQAGVAPRAV